MLGTRNGQDALTRATADTVHNGEMRRAFKRAFSPLGLSAEGFELGDHKQSGTPTSASRSINRQYQTKYLLCDRLTRL
jgi:hypothetical protein